jgi:hypothetical protein
LRIFRESSNETSFRNQNRHNLLKRIRFLLSIAAAAIALTGSVGAATITYTLAGGAATGSLNGVSFTATSFSITATGDSSAIQSELLFGVIPGESNVVSAPLVQINTISGPLTTTLISDTPGYLWKALGFLATGPYSSFHGFTLADNIDDGTVWAGLNNSYSSGDLSTPAIYYSATNTFAGPFPSTAGALILNSSAPTSFTVSVPEPATATSSLLLSLGGLSLISRRNRKA